MRAGGVHSPWHSRTSLTRRDGTGMVGRERLGCSLRLASYCETTRGDIKEIEHICMRKARAETTCFPDSGENFVYSCKACTPHRPSSQMW